VQNHKDDDDDGGDERWAKHLGLQSREKREKGKGKKAKRPAVELYGKEKTP
jgi:hypothetical protein